MAAPTLHAEFNQTASPGTSGTSTAIAVSPGDLLTVVFIVDVESSGTPSFRVKNNDATSGHNLITEEETIAPSATGTKIYADGSASTQIWDVRARSSAATGIVYVWSVRIDAASTSNSLAIVYTVPINTRARYSTRTSTPASGNVWPVRASRVQASGTLTDWATGGGDQTLTLSTVDDGRREMLISGLDQGGSTDSVVTLDADHDGSFEISDTDLGTVGAHVFYGYYDRTDAHRPGTGSSNDQKLVAHCSTSWGTNSGNAWAAIVYAAERPFVAITFPTETDSNPAALGRLKSRTLGLASDTEIALPMTQAHQPKFIPIARVDEPDSAITIRPTHRNTLGYPTETDSSIHVTRSRYITFPTETDTAQPLSQILTLTGEVGLAAPDPDCALIALRVTAYKAYAADVGDIRIALKAGPNTFVVTSAWQALTTTPTVYTLPITGTISDYSDLRAWWQTRRNGTDSLTPIITTIDLTVTVVAHRATEPDTALPVSHRKIRAITFPTEADLTLFAVHRKSRAVGIAAEIDSQPVRLGRARNIRQATETDTAFTLHHAVNIHTASEADAIPAALGRAKRRTIGIATELSTVFKLGRGLGIFTAAETDSAFTIHRAGFITHADETDAALPIARTKRRTTTFPTETDTPTPLTARRIYTLRFPFETDAARPVTRPGIHSIGIAAETDSAFVILAPHRIRIGIAGSGEQALPITVLSHYLGVDVEWAAQLAALEWDIELAGSMWTVEVADAEWSMLLISPIDGGPLVLFTLPHLSKEYVPVRVRSRQGSLELNPTVDVVEIAFTAAGVDPVSGDWQAASWLTDSAVTPNRYYARRLAQSLAPGNYDVWCRVTDSPEVPVRRAGRLVIA